MTRRKSLLLIIGVMAIVLNGCGTTEAPAAPTSTLAPASVEQAAAGSPESPAAVPSPTSVAADAITAPDATPAAIAQGAQAAVSTPIAAQTGTETPVAAPVPPAQIAANTGILEVRVTDAPGDVEKIDVTISKLQVHRAGAGAEEGWIEVFSTSTTKVDPIIKTARGLN